MADNTAAGGWDRDAWAADMIATAARLGGRRAQRSDLTVLGLPPDATIDDVRTQYRRLAKQLHPDMGGDAAAFRRLNAAYEWATGDLDS